MLASFNSFKVRLKEEIVAIQWNDGGCSITTRAGSTLHCQHVIITLPLGVLQVGMPSIPQCSFHIITLQGKPQEPIPTKSGERSIGGVGQPWSRKSEQSVSGMGDSLVERRRRISQDCQIKVYFVVTCMLLLYVCKSDVSFLKGKNVKEYAYRKTGMIRYLDLLRFNSLLLDV